MAGCSTKKDRFINRHWHAAATKWNVMHNGKEALEEGKRQLNASYVDNYWEVLPVERMEVKEVIVLPGKAQNPSFQRAEEKATKAIQKHSMNIRSRQRNYKIDEAYLLLGQARYYDQRFIPAIEAFNYTIKNYPESDDFAVASVWREKTNLRLENEELAIENLQKLLKSDADLDDQTYADARATLAQAYINQKVIDTAILHLKVASALTKDVEERGRYYYIIGQLYNKLDIRDTANIAFDKVIELNRRIPREYLVNAQLGRMSNYEYANLPDLEILEALTDMSENRENRPFLDKIYRQLGDYFYNRDSVDRAVDYYNKSLRTRSRDRFLNALNYEDLAQVNFDASQYNLAGSYIDSTLNNLEKNTLKFRRLKKRRDNLEDVIKYEGVAKRDDSIIHIVRLPKEEREALFTQLIDSLKAKAEAERLALEEAEKARERALRNNNSITNATQNIGGPNAGDQFYFYNNITASYGKNEFRRVWGDRQLEDNWRLLNKAIVSGEVGTTTSDGGEHSEEGVEKRFTLEYYTDQVPTDEAVIDSIVKERDFAYYQLGLIYKEKFRDYELAASRLQQLLKNEPEEKLVLPAKYNLYKIYDTTGSNAAEAAKQDILANYPDSRYAQILLNPSEAIVGTGDSPEEKYAEVYKLFKEQEFEKAIDKADEQITHFTGEDIVPKLEMLKASAIGRIEGFQAYQDALNYVALTYPNSPEGKEAQRRVDVELKKIAGKTLDKDPNKRSKLIFPFKESEKEQAIALTRALERALVDLDYRYHSASLDVYDRNQLLVVVHGFTSLDRAEGFAELLKVNKDYHIDSQNFVISNTNYKTVQIHKNLNEYLDESQTQ